MTFSDVLNKKNGVRTPTTLYINGVMSGGGGGGGGVMKRHNDVLIVWRRRQ